MNSKSEDNEWTLVWNDEFDGEVIDRSIWSFEIGYVIEYIINQVA